MKKTQTEKENDGMKFVCLFIVIIAFALAFVLLINKQNKDTYLADIEESNFSVKPQVGKVIVAKDEDAIYPRYYAIFINDNIYSIYVYNYYDTISQYNLEFNRLKDQIVDYNIKDKMIRYLHTKGYGTYDEVLNNLPLLIDSENITIY